MALWHRWDKQAHQSGVSHLEVSGSAWERLEFATWEQFLPDISENSSCSFLGNSFSSMVITQSLRCRTAVFNSPLTKASNWPRLGQTFTDSLPNIKLSLTHRLANARTVIPQPNQVTTAPAQAWEFDSHEVQRWSLVATSVPFLPGARDFPCASVLWGRCISQDLCRSPLLLLPGPCFSLLPLRLRGPSAHP